MVKVFFSYLQRRGIISRSTVFRGFPLIFSRWVRYRFSLHFLNFHQGSGSVLTGLSYFLWFSHLPEEKASLWFFTFSIKQIESCLQQPLSGFGIDFKSPELIMWLWDFKKSHQTPKPLNTIRIEAFLTASVMSKGVHFKLSLTYAHFRWKKSTILIYSIWGFVDAL